MATPFDVISDMVDYLRSLAVDHSKINGFLVAQSSANLNLSSIDYPVMVLEGPIQMTPITDINMGDIVRLSFKVGVYTNLIYDVNGNPTVVTTTTYPLPSNEILSTELKPQDQLIRNSMEIMSHLIMRAKDDFQYGVITGRLVASTFGSLMEVNNDSAYGCSTIVEIELEDGYGCDYLNHFTSTM